MYGDPQEIISSSIISVHSLENPERHGRVPERVLSAFRWLSIDVRIILNCQTSTGNMEWGHNVFPSNIYQVASGGEYDNARWDLWAFQWLHIGSRTILDCTMCTKMHRELCPSAWWISVDLIESERNMRMPDRYPVALCWLRDHIVVSKLYSNLSATYRGTSHPILRFFQSIWRHQLFNIKFLSPYLRVAGI